MVSGDETVKGEVCPACLDWPRTANLETLYNGKLHQIEITKQGGCMVMTELQEYIYLCEDIAKLKDIKYGQYTRPVTEMLGNRFVELHYYLAAKANKWNCEIRFSDDADFIEQVNPPNRLPKQLGGA